jgi:hypothetical protein
MKTGVQKILETDCVTYTPQTMDSVQHNILNSQYRVFKQLKQQTRVISNVYV